MSASKVEMSTAQWEAFLASLFERDDRIERKEAGQTYPKEEQVDAYALSAHAEALQSAEVDGDLWGTLEDIEEQASSEEEAWQNICAFYLERGCVLIQVTDAPEREEWILAEGLARRLGLLT